MDFMTDEVQTIQLSGKPYVILPREDYERLRLLAKAETLPPLPAPDERGTVPAVEYVRASLARSLIQQRAELGLSQAELAKLSGVRVETLCRIETGKVSPSTATMERLERGFEKAVKPKRLRQQSK
jgi:DNA-binding XRE family transcriptional regulator